MAKKNSEAKTTEVLENPELLADKLTQAEDFVKSNQKLLSYIGIALAVVVGGIIAFFYYQSTQEEEAQTALFPAIYLFEKDSFDLALNGNGVHTGLLEIADSYSLTKAGKLASMYAGIAYMKKGLYDDAIPYLEQYNGGDVILQAAVFALLGDAHMEKQLYDEAVTYYKKAAEYKPNKQYSPAYMMKWALAVELAGNPTESAKIYEKLIANYPQAQEVNDAKKYLGKVLPLVK
jgi:tetratricopeptide (TPR) repeat protein